RTPDSAVRDDGMKGNAVCRRSLIHPTRDRERIYGYELMTPQERNEYHARMRALNIEQEREAFRLEHHEKMQERARAQGKTLPDTPPAGRGPGMGPGMGPGGGMGPGYRR
ncbi:MAG TPA: hypothetical protein VJ325_09175, partial [Thiobacillus sp.]|nr:hypothetical protein [Thiobacillus sp.]